MRIIDFSMTRGMSISSICFPRKDLYKETWVSPDGFTQNQIDHILIDGRHATDIHDVHRYRGTDCDTDNLWWKQNIIKK
jgi:hypothetical protein